jgi:hypothetical protein
MMALIGCADGSVNAPMGYLVLHALLYSGDGSELIASRDRSSTSTANDGNSDFIVSRSELSRPTVFGKKLK